MPITTDEVAGVELQPVAFLTVLSSVLAPRLGITFSIECDDLDRFEAAAFRIDGIDFLLRCYERAPLAGTAVHTPTPGDPADQLAVLLRAFDLAAEVQSWWDGTRWREDPFPHAA